MNPRRWLVVVALVAGPTLLIAVAAHAGFFDAFGWFKDTFHWYCPGGCG